MARKPCGKNARWVACTRSEYLGPLARNSTFVEGPHVFHKEGSPQAEAFVRERLLRVLQGKASGVIRGLREMASKRALAGAAPRTLRKCAATWSRI